MKILCAFLCFSFLLTILKAETISTSCIFDMEEFKLLNYIYTCELERFHRNTIDHKVDFNITGTHLISKTNNDVQAFKIDVHRMKIFPSSLEKFFPNLRVIYVNEGPLQFMNQSDLKPFPNLHTLDLHDNQIEIIEADLFKYNSRLEIIWLSDNKIFEIHPNVFDHLTILHYLHLINNPCISHNALGNQTHVNEIINLVKKQCVRGAVTPVIPELDSSEYEEEHRLHHLNEVIKEFEDIEYDWENRITYIYKENEKPNQRYTAIFFIMFAIIFILTTVLAATCLIYRRQVSNNFGTVSMQRLMT